MENYKVVNGISFKESTPMEVCKILSNVCGTKQRVRIFYGDKNTGKDWCEMYYTIGYINKSCGRVSIPLLVSRKISLGGYGILDNCIVKITIDKKVVYQHENYHCSIEKRGNEIYDTEKNSCIFRNDLKVNRLFDFLKGLRNAC